MTDTTRSASGPFHRSAVPLPQAGRIEAFEIIEQRDIAVRARDGVELATNVYLPGRDAAPAARLAIPGSARLRGGDPGRARPLRFGRPLGPAAPGRRRRRGPPGLDRRPILVQR